MKIKYPLFNQSRIILVIMCLTILGCAFLGNVVDEGATSSSGDGSDLSTVSAPANEGSTPDFDSQARFLIKDGGYGYIDQKGKMVIPPTFPKAGNFHEGLAAAVDSRTELAGYIDYSGKFVIEPKYESVGIFSEGLALVQYPNSDTLICIDQDGENVFEIPYRDLESSFPEEYAYKEEYVLQELYSNMGNSGFSFHDGLALISVEIRKDPAYWEPNYIDRQGKLLFPNGSIVYESASSFSDGFALVKFAESFPEVTIIDTNGKKVAGIQCPPGASCSQGDGVNRPFSEGVTMMYANDGTAGRLYGFINVHGAFVIPPVYGGVVNFSNGLAAVYDPETELYGYIDHSGTLVIPHQFVSEYFGFSGRFSEGLAPVTKPDGQCEYIDTSGRMVINLCGGAFVNGLAYIFIGEKTGYIDTNGNFVYIDPE